MDSSLRSRQAQARLERVVAAYSQYPTPQASQRNLLREVHTASGTISGGRSSIPLLPIPNLFHPFNHILLTQYSLLFQGCELEGGT